MLVKGEFVRQIRGVLKKEYYAAWYGPKEPVKVGRFSGIKRFLQRFVRCMKGEDC